MSTTVGVLHPGQMGAAVAGQLTGRGVRVLWCPDGRGPHSAARAAEVGLTATGTLAGLLDAADVVLSICPPAAAEEVAGTVAAHGYGGLLVEANAISPARYGRIAALVRAAGGQPVDGSIIGGPPGASGATRLYVSGAPEAADRLAGLFAGTRVEVVPVAGPPGSASALKMAFGGYQKASRALVAVAHALAAEHGVSDHLLAEAARASRSPLADTAYLPGLAARAWRWAPEMREVADALGGAGLPPHLALAAAEVMAHWQDDKDDWDIALPDVLAHLRRPAG